MRIEHKSNNIKWFIFAGVILITSIIIILISLKGKKTVHKPVVEVKEATLFNYRFNTFEWGNIAGGIPSINWEPEWTSARPEILPVDFNKDRAYKVYTGIAQLNIQPKIELINPPTESIVRDDFAKNLSTKLAKNSDIIKGIADELGDGGIIPMRAKVYDGFGNQLRLFNRPAVPGVGYYYSENTMDPGNPYMDEFWLIKKSTVSSDDKNIWHWIPEAGFLQFMFNVNWSDFNTARSTSKKKAIKISDIRVPLGTEIHKIVFELQNSDIKIPYNLDSPIIIKGKEQEEEQQE